MRHQGWRFGLVAAAILALRPAPAPAQTDGIMTCKVTTVASGQTYDPRNVLAVWIADSTNGFVKTVMKYSKDRTTYLYKWIANSARSTNTDTISGATLSSHGARTVLWNGRDKNGSLVPDGAYWVRMEFTGANAQGPVSTNYVRFTKGSSSVSTNFTNLANFQSLSLTWTPVTVSHDVGVVRVGLPTIVNTDSTVQVPVVTTNKTTTAETFALSLSNQTDGVLVGQTTVTALAGNASRTNTFVWDTAGLLPGAYTLAAYAAAIPGETVTADNLLTTGTTARVAFHDVAVGSFTAPALIVPGATSNLTVLATNRGDFVESFLVAVTDRTDGVSIGLRTIGNLPAYAGTNLTFAWATAGRSQGYHAVVATAGVVTDDADALNNTNARTVAIASGLSTGVVSATGGVWRYHDLGIDLHGGPWTTADYYDGHWALGSARFGFGDPGMVTTVKTGNLCYYFRRDFFLDMVPLTMNARLLRDDGVVVYINGLEAFRDNMDALQDPAYSNVALAAVSGTAETNWFPFAIDPGLLRPGRNVLAVELHQNQASSSDVAMDLELSAVTPSLAFSRDVAVESIRVPGSATAGDRLAVGVRVRNAGQAVETFTVTLTDTNTGASAGAQAVASLEPGGWRDLAFAWDTRGVAPGAHVLRALAGPVAGETNTADNAATAPASIAGSGVSLARLDAAGSIGGFCGAVVVQGTRAYAAEGASLVAYDIGVPSSPVRLGRLRLNGVIEGLAANATHVFAASGASGVHVVDAATPSAMSLLATWDGAGHSRGLALDGTRLYVADGVGGLRILDVSSPASPSLLGGLATTGPARALAVNGTTVYVVDQHDGLLIVDAGSPSSPTVIGVCDRVTAGEGLALSGSHAIVAGAAGLLSVISVASPSAPVLVTNVPLAGAARALAVSGGTAYVPLGASGLAVVDVATPAAPAVLATPSTAGEASGVAVSGTTAFVADGFGGLRVLNVTAPASPALVVVTGDGLRARGSAASTNGHLYVAAGENGVDIWCVTNPAGAFRAGRFAGAASAVDVAVHGARLYVADGAHGLRVAELSSPTQALLRATWTNASVGALVSVAGDAARAVVSDGRRIACIDATVPASPALAGLADGGGADASAVIHQVAIAGNAAVAASGEAGLRVYNLPGMLLAGSLGLPGPALGVAVSGTTACVACGTGGWAVVDVAAPSSPSLVGVAHGGQGAVGAVASGGRLVHVAGLGPAAASLDMSAPLTPVEKRAFAPLTRALRMSARGVVAFASEDDAGVAILDAVPDDHNLNGLPDSFDRQIVDADPDDAIASPDDVRPEDDFDGDGATNRQELVAGTDATDPGSVFMCPAAPGALAGNRFVVRWTSVAGKTYAVRCSTNLLTGAGFQVIQGAIPGTGGVNAYTATVSAASCFFMVEVE